MSANREALIRVAGTLRPLLDELVFVGGRVVELYLTDPVSPRPRPTNDTDAVCGLCTYSEYQELEERLRRLGLRHDTSQGAHICRWLSDTDTIDVLPADPSVFGFNSRWYSYGIDTAQEHELAEGVVIRIFTPTVFIADKLDAFEGRGAVDPRTSVDLEDLVAVVGGRQGLVAELEDEDPELRAWVAERVQRIFCGDLGEETIESLLPRIPDRTGLLDEVSARLREIARLQ